MKIKEAKEIDISIIQKIAYSAWPQAFSEILSNEQIDYMLDMMYSVESLKVQINQLNHKFLIIFEEEKNLGYISYEIDYDVDTTKIHKIYILPEIKKKGLGKKMIKEVETKIKGVNSKLTLNVNRFNNAVDFYEHIGFYKAGTEDIDIGQGFFMEDYIMEKKLN